jgi:hypothetical protein
VIAFPALSAALTRMPIREARPRSSFAVSMLPVSVLGSGRNGAPLESRTSIPPPATPLAPSASRTRIVCPAARLSVTAGGLASSATVAFCEEVLPAASVTTIATSRLPSPTGSPASAKEPLGNAGHGTGFVKSHVWSARARSTPSTSSCTVRMPEASDALHLIVSEPRRQPGESRSPEVDSVGLPVSSSVTVAA